MTSSDIGAAAVGREGSLPIRRLLRALQIMAVLCMLTSAVHNYGLALHGGEDWAAYRWDTGDLHAVQAVVVSLLWLLRGHMRTRRSRAAVAFLAVLAVMPMFMIGRIAEAGFMIPVLLVAYALVVLDGWMRAALILAGLECLSAIAVHLMVRPRPVGLVIGMANAAPVFVLLMIGIVLGAALAAYEQGRRRDEQTIAERDDALQRLEDALAQLHSQAQTEKELMLADERARSARDLHDGLGHRLTLISMSLDYARRMRERDAAAAWSEVDTAAQTSADALTEMRTWVRALSPVRDRNATGTAAIDAIAESFRGTGLDVALERSGPEPILDEDTSLLIYRAVQEGLTNALRHGRARQVRMSVETTADTVHLTLRNDLDAAARAAIPVGPLAPGFGLRGLTDRADALGGDVRACRDGDEVELRVTVPSPAARGAVAPVRPCDSVPTAAQEATR